MSRPPSRLLNLPARCLAQARCPASRSGSSKGMDREGCVSVSRRAGCGLFCLPVRTGRAGATGSGWGSVREVSLALVSSVSPAVGAGAYPGPGEEIKRISCQSVLPFYGFWPCPLVLTQPPSGSLCCGPAPAGSGPSREGLFAVKTQGLGEQHVACQAEISEILGPAPRQGPRQLLQGRGLGFLPRAPMEQVGPHLTSQSRGSRTL